MDKKFNFLLECLSPFFNYKDCSFGYQRKNCKKHGHLKKKINKKTNEVSYELKIEQFDNEAAKVYTLIHELTHLLNDHLDNKDITYAQKEWVADEVSMYFIKSFGFYDLLKKSEMAKKWNIDIYGESHIKNKKISDKRKQIMIRQKTETIKSINNQIKTRLK